MKLRVKEFVDQINFARQVNQDASKYEGEVLGVQVFDRFDDALVYDGPAEWIETTQKGVYIIAHDQSVNSKYDKKHPPALSWEEIHGSIDEIDPNRWGDIPEVKNNITVGKLKKLLENMNDEDMLDGRIYGKYHLIALEEKNENN